jgi:hypothetical protein
MSWPGMKESDYLKTFKAIDVENKPPLGLITHAATATKNGMDIVDIWESEADFNSFVTTRMADVAKALNLTSKPTTEIVKLTNFYKSLSPKDCEAYDKTTHTFARS